MKKSRSPRKPSSQQCAIVANNPHLCSSGVLKNISETGVLFYSQDEFEPSEHIILCPVFDLSGGLPSPEEVKKNPYRFEGTIVRKEGRNQYGVQLNLDSDSVRTIQYAITHIQIEEGGILIAFTLEGEPNLKEFIKFRDLIKQKSAKALRLLLDFSQLNKIPQVGAAMLKDLFEDLTREQREIAVINCDVACPKSIHKHSISHLIKEFSTREEAKHYFQNNPIKILIVEDDEVTAQFVIKFLEKYHLKPIAALTGKEGIDSARREGPELILMDIHLPDMSGIDVVEKLRDRTETHYTPVIMLTVESSKEAVEACIKHQIKDYVLKPFKSEVLYQKIFTVLLQARKENNRLLTQH